MDTGLNGPHFSGHPGPDLAPRQRPQALTWPQLRFCGRPQAGPPPQPCSLALAHGRPAASPSTARLQPACPRPTPARGRRDSGGRPPRTHSVRTHTCPGLTPPMAAVPRRAGPTGRQEGTWEPFSPTSRAGQAWGGRGCSEGSTALQPPGRPGPYTHTHGPQPKCRSQGLWIRVQGRRSFLQGEAAMAPAGEGPRAALPPTPGASLPPTDRSPGPGSCRLWSCGSHTSRGPERRGHGWVLGWGEAWLRLSPEALSQRGGWGRPGSGWADASSLRGQWQGLLCVCSTGLPTQPGASQGRPLSARPRHLMGTGHP